MLNYFSFVPEGVNGCKVEAYLQESWRSNEIAARKVPSVIVCPGGGYCSISDREQFPVGREFLAAGYHVFILTYSVNEDARNFNPLCQLAATISHIRKHAEEWMADPDKIAVSGFSAGGHLAASIGTLALSEEFQKVWCGDSNILPNAMVLAYPVLLANEFAHAGTIRNVSGCGVGTETYRYFGLDQHVCKQTPPTFLWHTVEDQVVPVENSLQFASALYRVGVPFELHVFPEGKHGMSTCTQEVDAYHPHNARWVSWAIAWLNQIFGFTK
ncbi:MAG: alpha/beta hydrolase [Oscillospiraceae bacterium]|nr:alpha/beta hydrolase [Oscillospiraceae bacterium]